MADLVYSGPTDSANGAAGQGPGAPMAHGAADPSQVTGQDPASVFGIPLNYSTGLGGSAPPGSESATGNSGDPTNQPNQYPDQGTFSHVPFGGTGLGGSQGAPQSQVETPGASFQVTDPNYTAGRPGGGSGVQLVAAQVAVGGHGDSTMVSGQYPPANPILPGDYYPDASGAGEGSVKVGGFLKGQRG